MGVECTSKVQVDRKTPILAHEIREWLAGVPDGATVTQIIRDFGTQRDPEPTLVGLRAAWSEAR